jgi:hypothetical protein
MNALQLSRAALGVGAVGICVGVIDPRTGLAIAGAILAAAGVIAVAITEARTRM